MSERGSQSEREREGEETEMSWRQLESLGGK